MVGFICKGCGYKSESSDKPGKCPYCGKESIEEQQDAEEIIEEVEKILE